MNTPITAIAAGPASSIAPRPRAAHTAEPDAQLHAADRGLRFRRWRPVLLAVAIFFGTVGSATADPTMPTSVQASASSATSVRLTWTRSSVEGSRGYQIFRCQGCYPASTPYSSSPNRTPYASVGPGINVYNDTNVQAGKTYSYQVRAYSCTTAGTCYSGLSKVATVTTSSATPTPTPTPSPAPSPTPTPTPTPSPTAGNDTCGQQLSTAPPAQWSHVVWIVMENKAYSQIIGSSSAPYTNSLASKCGLATNYSAVTHPSLPNYIAMTSGSPQGITDDASPASHPLNVPSIFSQLPGGSSGSLEEGMPAKCQKTDAYPYAVKHNPEAYFTNLGTDCANYDVPLGATPDVSRRFTFVTPNMCNDTHDCSIATGDSWLSRFIPKIVQTPDYQSGKTVVFLTYDEDDSSSSNRVVTEVLSAHTAPGSRSTATLNHYNLLGTTEDLLGLPRLGNAAGKASMGPAFGLTTAPSPSTGALLFDDEFNGLAGQSPDATKWSVYGGATPPSWGVECFVNDPQHVALDGQGHLVLTATAATTTPCTGDTEPGILSGGLETGSRSLPKFTFKYGDSEARIAFDCLAGEWPTYWHSGGTAGMSWPTDGEIDVLEGFSGGAVVNQGIWMSKASSSSSGGQIHSNWTGQWCGTGFHTYRVRWEPGKITFYIDGALKRVWTASDASAAGLVWPFDASGYVQRIITELSLGGAAGTVNTAGLPMRETIDYVRIAPL